jgi:alpha-galactosidase
VIEAENAHLELRLDLARLCLDLRARQHGIVLSGFRAAARVEGRTLLAEAPLLDGWGEIRTRHGVGVRIQVHARTALPLDLVLALEIGSDWPGIVLETALESRAEESFRVESLTPLDWARDAGGELELPGDPAATRFLRMGYQSWSPARYLRLTQRDFRPRFALVRRVHHGPCTPLPSRTRHVSDFITRLVTPGAGGLTLGFVTHRRLLTHVCLEHRGARIDAIRAVAAREGLPLAARAAVGSERLWVGVEGPEEDGLARWAEHAGREMEAPVPARVESGWCSWYHFFTRVGARDIERNLEAAAEFRGQIDTMQIDDGYQAAVGDWLEPDPSFPEGIAPLGRAIREHGFRAGIWLAPFLASRASRVAREHPDWLLRDGRGRPIVALLNPSWKGKVCYALDPTHPGVRDWLAGVSETLRGQGFDYLKLDFLYAGALRGLRQDPSLASAEAYRVGLGAIRQAIGPQSLLLGCGAPLGPSIGLFEAMRIGPDVAPAWRARVADRLYGLPAAPSAENSIRNVLARAPLHQRLWINDPDCVLLREHDTRLDETEVRTLAGVVALSGGPVIVSDDLAEVGGERRQLLRRILPSLGRAPEVDPLETGEVPERLRMRFPDGSLVLLWVNLANRAREAELRLADLGVEAPAYAYDVWGDRLLGPLQAELRTGPIPPRGSFLVRLYPAGRLPAVVGSSLHVAAGALETVRVREEATGGVTLRLALPGRRTGRVLVAARNAAPVSAHVRFTDEVELRVAAAGVEERSEIPDA